MSQLAPTDAGDVDVISLARRLGGVADQGEALDETIAELERQRDEIDQRIAEARSRRDTERQSIDELRESMSREDLFRVIGDLVARIEKPGPRADAATQGGPGADGDGSSEEADRGIETQDLVRNDPQRIFREGYDLGFGQDPDAPALAVGTKGWRKNGYNAGRTDKASGRDPVPNRAYALLLDHQRKFVPHDLRHYLADDGDKGEAGEGAEGGSTGPLDGEPLAAGSQAVGAGEGDPALVLALPGVDPDLDEAGDPAPDLGDDVHQYARPEAEDLVEP